MSERTGKRGLLSVLNPGPLKLVPAAVRDVWKPKPHRWRCDYTDGRGRCRSRETKGKWNAELHCAEHYCERHTR